MDRHTRTHTIKAADVNGAAWFKSTYSDSTGNACVEVADVRLAYGRIAIKDSKQQNGPAFLVSPEAFAAFASGAADGTYGA